MMTIRPNYISALLATISFFCPTNYAYASEEWPELMIIKKSIQIDDDPSLTGSQVRPATYAITVFNRGRFSALDRAIDIIDQFPESVVFNNVDFDGEGPGNANFYFDAENSGLMLHSADIILIREPDSEFSDLHEGADERVRKLRIHLSGVMNPGSRFTVKFRVFDIDKRTSLFEIYDDQNTVLIDQPIGSVAMRAAD